METVVLLTDNVETLQSTARWVAKEILGLVLQILQTSHPMGAAVVPMDTHARAPPLEPAALPTAFVEIQQTTVM